MQNKVCKLLLLLCVIVMCVAGIHFVPESHITIYAHQIHVYIEVFQ